MDSLVFACGSGSSLDLKMKNQQSYHLLTQQDSAWKQESPLPCALSWRAEPRPRAQRPIQTQFKGGAYYMAVGTPWPEPAAGGVPSAGAKGKDAGTRPTS